ncbi:TRAP transporter small permease [Lacibacterium aquatile]|uniref:TRAP transporter small permease protein n=1 Tax=Lacibacterium aquatile TaxID=1168082 RepID=A0ABW5DSY5_9PROT
MDLLTRFNATIARYCMYGVVAGVFVLVAVVTWQVFGRYVLNDTPTWAEAVALVLVLYVTLIGASVGVRDSGHIGMESFLVLLPERARHGFEILIHILTGTFGAVMAWYGYDLAAAVAPYKMPLLGISEAVNHVPLVIAGILITLFSIEHVIALVRGIEVEPSWH